MSVRDRIVIQSNALTDAQRLAVSQTLAHHGGVDRDKLAYVCLGCGSIGECTSRDHRVSFVTSYNVACCNETVVFHTSHESSDNPHRTGRVPFGPWVEHSPTCKCNVCR
jgi:hypothetical protein